MTPAAVNGFKQAEPWRSGAVGHCGSDIQVFAMQRRASVRKTRLCDHDMESTPVCEGPHVSMQVKDSLGPRVSTHTGLCKSMCRSTWANTVYSDCGSKFWGHYDVRSEGESFHGDDNSGFLLLFLNHKRLNQVVGMVL